MFFFHAPSLKILLCSDDISGLFGLLSLSLIMYCSTKTRAKILLHSLCYSDCTTELLGTVAIDNGIPFCGREVEDYGVYITGLSPDLAPDTFSREDMVVKWSKIAPGVNRPGKYATLGLAVHNFLSITA